MLLGGEGARHVTREPAGQFEISLPAHGYLVERGEPIVHENGYRFIRYFFALLPASPSSMSQNLSYSRYFRRELLVLYGKGDPLTQIHKQIEIVLSKAMGSSPGIDINGADDL